jgi:hypothetical protein
VDSATSRSILDLEGRVAALSGVLALLVWVLRERGIIDPALEQQIYRRASDAVASLPPEMEAGADRIILALQAAAMPMKAA